MRKKSKKSPYDEVADLYSEMWEDAASYEEDDELFNVVIKQKGKTILDIGCGQGLLLKHWEIDPNDYKGIEPSGKMIEWFDFKNGCIWDVTQMTFEEWINGIFLVDHGDKPIEFPKFDTVVAIYGTASYIDPEYFQYIPELLAEKGEAWLMFFKESYRPVETHKHMKKPPKVYPFDVAKLLSDMGEGVNGGYSRWRNYEIIHIIK